MATTRAKKTIKFNPLAVSESTKQESTGLLQGLSADAVKLESVPSPKLGRKTKSEAKPKTEVKLKSQPKAKPVKPSQAKTGAAVKISKVDAKSSPAKKKTKVLPKVEAPTVDAPAVEAPALEIPVAEEVKSKSCFGWARRKPSVQAPVGTLLSAHEIVPGPKENLYGFYEGDGSFVSLMQLEGPITQSGKRFLPLALASFAVGGPLGLIAASLLNTSPNAIFLARQPSGESKYVSLDSKGLGVLKGIALISPT